MRTFDGDLHKKSRTAILIIDADRLENAALISFDNGVNALYPAEVLYSHLDEAEVLPDDDTDES